METRPLIKNRYKVLPLPSPYKYKLDEDDIEDILNTGDIVIDPIFNRDGWYYDRHEKISWIESGYGCFRNKYPTMFLYNLGLMNHKLIPSKVLSAIKVLKNYNMCPKGLLRLLWKDEEVQDLRRICRDATRYRHALEKEWPMSCNKEI